MSGPFSQLNGLPIAKLHLVLPALGLWHADITLTQAVDVAAPQVLLLSGSTWNGAVIRAVDFSGERSVRIVGGTAGWRKSVPALQYSSTTVAGGVPTVTVLSDVAALVQELPPVLDPTIPFSVGTSYVRQAGPASLVLQDLEDRGVLSWWADPLGVVQTMPRPSTPPMMPFVAEQVRGAAGWYRIATEFPGEWMPGAVFQSATVGGIISRVEHRIDKGNLWSEVLVV
jgi:hypothetical protein